MTTENPSMASQPTREPKLCCALEGIPVALYALKMYDTRHSDWCSCGFKMCETCVKEIAGSPYTKNKPPMPSKLWPRGNEQGHVMGYIATIDAHYYSNPECPWVKAFIQQEGEPKLDGR